jgi:hypothetical protein
MLQPIEELQSCNADAKKSIDIGYSSLPPQFVVFKALSAQHFLLAGVCVMALLGNLLTVAFAGMFQQETIHTRHAIGLSPPLDLKFVAIDGDVGPMYSGGQAWSGGFRGRNGEDHLLIAESNFTRNTPLPPWTDEQYFYLPLFSEDAIAHPSGSIEANTQVFGAELDCQEVVSDDEGTFQASLELYNDTMNLMDRSVNITVSKGNKTFRCASPGVTMRRGPVGTGCSGGASAVELVLIMRALPESDNFVSAEAITACLGNVVLGWHRTNQDCSKAQLEPLTPQNSMFLHCRPKWMIGTARIRVNKGGRLLEKPEQIDMREASGKSSTLR